MKNIFHFILLMIIVSSCSLSIHEIPKDKIEYVNRVVICDFKSTNFKILNHDDIFEFFEDEKESIAVKYAATVGKKSDKNIFIGEREIKILRKSKDGKSFYLSSFKRKTFPFSNCRKLKTKPKYFK